ncbi:hypothetical protein RRF57_000175 [Xylaria bambusicola]|uniref:Uncharacterized protein n=1 Tax=Xylaria bambusicola TaxID=326684 RepID=A0AAN7U9D4_9PEZI
MTLRYSTQGSEVVVCPSGITGICTATPGCGCDVVVHDDGDAGVGQSLDNSGENIQSTLAEKVRVLVLYVRVFDDHFIGIGEAHTVEAEFPDAGGDNGAVLDLEPAGYE